MDALPLIVLLSAQVSREYLELLREKSISYVVTGSERIDLARAMEVLGETFGIRRLGLVGGGHINGAFLDAGLLDEVSLLYAPDIDGRAGQTAVFDGIAADREPFHLQLQEVRRCAEDVIWLRYAVEN